MDDKIKRLGELINGVLGKVADYDVRYVTEKTIVVTITNLNQQLIDSLKTVLPEMVVKLFKIRLGGFNVVKYSTNEVDIIMVDPSKVNYELYQNSMSIIKKLNLDVTACDNHFCKHSEYAKVCHYKKKYDYVTLYTETINRIRLADLSRIKDLSERDICSYIHHTSPSEKWINSQIAYIGNLSPLEKRVLYVYTTYGSALTNDLLRNNSKVNKDIFAFFRSHFSNFSDTFLALTKASFADYQTVESYIKSMISIIRKLIRGSPPSGHAFYIYRGTKDKLALREDTTYVTEAFQSCSVFTKVALPFSESSGSYGTIVKFRVRNKCLLISHSVYPQEYEILLDFGQNWEVKRYLKGAQFIKDGNLINADYAELR